MSEAVDTRVVEAKFDSKQFEQGVDRTVKKLDELKKSLNLKDGEKSVADIGSKIEETSEKASKSLEKLESRFTSFFGMLKQKLIGGIADEIVGSIFKVKNSIEGLVRSLSTGQIGYGMERYNSILTSVRTLTSAGVNQDKAYETIERLGQFADQTSYSLDELVSTMSKFKTAGASLETAQRMVEGLSNAAASMGVNAQQAGRAYLNMQQAYSKGVMLQNDWMSFESLPMVGEKFNKAILDAAVKVGTLQAEKVDKATGEILSYKTNTKKKSGVAGQKIRSAKGITTENMSSKLSSRFFTKEVMEEVFGNTYYFQAIDRQTLNSIKEKETKLKSDLKDNIITQKEYDTKFDAYLKEIADKRLEAKKEELDKMLKDEEITKEEHDKLLKEFEKDNIITRAGYEAFRAGQEARSLNDVLMTLKDTISRGWATTFELVFGKLDEAAEFFTKVTESQFAEGIYAIGEFRNAVLESWRANGGRTNMLGVLEYMDNLAGSIFKKLGLINDEEKYFNEHFDKGHFTDLMSRGLEEEARAYEQSVRDRAADYDPLADKAKELGQRLSIVGRNIRDFFEKVQKWFTEADSTGVSRLQRISNILDIFGKAATGALKVVGMGIEGIGVIYKTLKPTFDALWANIEKLLQPILDIVNPKKTSSVNIYNMVADALSNLNRVVSILVKPLTTILNVLGDVATFFIEMSAGTFVMNIQFFTDAFALLLEILGIGSAQQDRGAGVLDGISKGIEDFGNVCKEAFKAVSDFSESLISDLSKLLGLDKKASGEQGGFFTNISKFFETNEFVKRVTGWIDSAKEWIIKAADDIKEFIVDLPNRIRNIGIDIGDFFKRIFYTPVYNVGAGTVWMKKPLTAWLENTVNQVWNFITVEIPKFIQDLPSLVEEFFNGLFYEKTEVKKDKNGYYQYTDTRTPLKKWLDKAVEDVKAFIKGIPAKIKKIPSVIGEFFKRLFYTPVYNVGVGTVWMKKPITQFVDEHIVKPLKDFIKDLPTYIGQGIGTVVDFVGSVVSAIFGGKTEEAAKADVQDKIEEPFINIDTTNILESLKNVGRDIVNGAISIFSGDTNWTNNKNWIADKVASGINTIRTKAEEIWPKVKEFIVSLPTRIASLFSANEETGEKGAIRSAIDNFASSIGLWLSEIPDTLLSTWEDAEKQFGTIWNRIVQFVTGAGATDKLNAVNQAAYDTMLRNGQFDTAEMFKESALVQQWREDNPIFANLSDFFTHLAKFVVDKINKIPEVVTALYGKAVEIVSIISEIFTDVVSGNKKEDYGSPIKNKIADIFGSVVTWVKDELTTLPTKIKGLFDAGVDFVKLIADGLFGSGKDKELNEKNQGIYIVKFLDAVNDLNPRSAAGKMKALEEWEQKALEDQWKESNPVFVSIREFFGKIGDFLTETITNFPNTIAEAWNSLKEWVLGIPDTISGWFNQDAEDSAKEDGGIGSKIKEFVNGIGIWISQIPGDLLDIWEKAENLAGSFWGTIVDWIFGQGASNQKLSGSNFKTYEQMIINAAGNPAKLEEAEIFKKGALDAQWRRDNPIAANISDFFSKMLTYLYNKIKSIPDDIKGMFNDVVTIGGILVDVIKGEVKEDYDGNPMYNLIATSFTTIAGWIKDNIFMLPNKVKEVAKQGLDIGKIIFDSLLGKNNGKYLFDQKKYDEILSKGIGKTGSEELLYERLADRYMSGSYDYGTPLYNDIAQFFTNISEWIAKQIKELPGKVGTAVKGIVDFATEVGPAILDGLRSAIDWVSGKLTIATEWLEDIFKQDNGGSKSFIEMLDEKFTDQNTGEMNPLWSGVKKVGESLKTLLIDTMPKFIKEAALTIVKNIPNILNDVLNIGNLFGGNKKKETEVSEEDKKKYDEIFGTNKYSKILKKYGKNVDIANKIVDKSVKDAEKINEKTDEYWHTIEQTAKEASEVSSTSAKELEENGMGFIEIFASIFMPGGALADELNESNVDNPKREAKGFLAGAKEILDSVMEFIETFTNDKNLKIVGVIALIVYVLNQLKQIVDNISFIDDIGWTAKWIGFGALMTVISGILGWMAILAGQAVPGSEEEKKLERIKTVMKEFKQFILDITEPIKWIIGLSAAKSLFTMISGGSATNISMDASTDPTKTNKSKWKSFKSGLWDWTKNRGTDILEIFQTTVGGFLGTFTGTLGKTFGVSLGAGQIGNVVELIGGNLEGFLGELGSGMESLSGYLGDTITNLEAIKGKITPAIETIGEVKQLIKAFVELLYWSKDEVNDNIENNAMSKQDTIWALMDDAGFDVTIQGKNMAEKKVLDVEAALGKLNKLFGKLSGSLLLFKNSVSGYGEDAKAVASAMKDILNMTNDMQAFEAFAEDSKFDIFKQAFASVGALFKLYSDSVSNIPEEEPKELHIKNIVKMMQALFEDEDFIKLIEEYGKEGALPDVSKQSLDTAERIIIFATALTTIGDACEALVGETDEYSTNINALIETVNKIKINEDNIATVATNFGILGNALGSFAVETSGLDDSSITSASRALDMLLRLAVGLKNIPDSSFIAEMLWGDKSIDRFGVGIESLGGHLKSFFDKIDNLNPEGISVDYNESNMALALMVADYLGRIAAMLQNANIEGFKDFSSNIPDIAENIGSFIRNVLDEKKIPRFSKEDFEFINEVIRVLQRFVGAITGLNNVKIGDINAQIVGGKLKTTFTEIVNAGATLGNSLYINRTLLEYISTYGSNFNVYIDTINSIGDAFLKLNNLNLNGSTIRGTLESISQTLFGWKEQKGLKGGFIEEIYHEGMLSNFKNFLRDAKDLKTEVYGSAASSDVFMAITSIINGFTAMISDMSRVAALSLAYGTFTYNYEEIITSLSTTLRTIVTNQEVFESFFEFANSFSQSDLTKGLTLFSMLNQLSSSLHNFALTTTDYALNEFEYFDWQRLFEGIKENISKDTLDGVFDVSPTITPVLEITDDFKLKAAEMKQLLGFAMDEKGNWISPNVQVNVSPELMLPALDQVNTKLDDLAFIRYAVDQINATANGFNKALESMQFIIQGKEFTYAIGPDFDEWLGSNGYAAARGNINQGSDG